MNTVSKLLALFRVDQQIGGLESRLKTAERFLKAQSGTLTELTTRREALETQRRQLRASVANLEGESNGIQERIVALREKMNSAKTNKEYQAFLVEVSSLTAERSRLDEQALGQMTKVEALESEMADLDGQLQERTRIQATARQDRDDRANEIRDRLEELKGERSTLAKNVPSDAMASYNARRTKFEEDVEIMAPLDAQNFRRHEFTCGACMIGAPVDVVNAVAAGRLTSCPSCGVILYLEEHVLEKLVASTQKK